MLVLVCQKSPVPSKSLQGGSRSAPSAPPSPKQPEKRRDLVATSKMYTRAGCARPRQALPVSTRTTCVSASAPVMRLGKEREDKIDPNIDPERRGYLTLAGG